MVTRSPRYSPADRHPTVLGGPKPPSSCRKGATRTTAKTATTNSRPTAAQRGSRRRSRPPSGERRPPRLEEDPPTGSLLLCTQNFANLSQEILLQEGLLQEAGQSLSLKRSQSSLSAVTAHQYDRHIFSGSAHLPKGRCAVHPRHGHVQDHKLDLLPMLPEHVHPFLSVLSGQNPSALALQHAPADINDLLLFVHQQ